MKWRPDPGQSPASRRLLRAMQSLGEVLARLDRFTNHEVVKSSGVSAGKVVEAPVINTDWLPTLLELAGQPAPSGLDGVSFAAGLTGQAQTAARHWLWSSAGCPTW